MGEVDGLFIEEDSVVAAHIGKQVYFGEILGKHSDIHGKLEKGDLTVMSDDQAFIAEVERVFGDTRLSGFCPLDYLSEDEENEDFAEEDED